MKNGLKPMLVTTGTTTIEEMSKLTGRTPNAVQCILYRHAVKPTGFTKNGTARKYRYLSSQIDRLVKEGAFKPTKNSIVQLKRNAKPEQKPVLTQEYMEKLPEFITVKEISKILGHKARAYRLHKMGLKPCGTYNKKMVYNGIEFLPIYEKLLDKKEAKQKLISAKETNFRKAVIKSEATAPAPAKPLLSKKELVALLVETLTQKLQSIEV